MCMKDFFSVCPVETTLNLIGNKWKFLIIRDLLQGTKRFGELKKSIGASKNQSISQNVLTQNLRELEEAKLIARKVYAEVPPPTRRIQPNPTWIHSAVCFDKSRILG